MRNRHNRQGAAYRRRPAWYTDLRTICTSVTASRKPLPRRHTRLVLESYELLTTSDADLVQARPLGKPSHWFLFVGEPGLEGDDVEVRDHLEVAHVKRDDIEAEMEGCGSDDEVRKVDADPLAHLLAVDTPGQPRHFQRERMHCHRLEEFSTKFSRRLRSAPVLAR